MNFINYFITRINRVFILLGLRQGTRRFWGIVYDSVTKQPLDPVTVKLISVSNNATIQSCITDMSGRYGFLVKPGRYKIFAAKEHYRFPSQNLTGESDGIYTDLYHGEYIEVLGDSEVIAPNIPLDPLDFDWNQQAKRQYFTKRPYVNELLKRLIELFFWFFFISSFIFFSFDLTKNLTITLNWPFYVLIGYLLVLIFNKIIPPVRLWGQVINKKTKEPIADLQIELTNPAVPNIIMGRAKTASDGKFFLRANKGSYLLRLKFINHNNQPKEAGLKKIKVYREGVVNRTFYIDLNQ